VTRSYVIAFLNAREAGSDAVTNAIVGRSLLGAASSGGRPIGADVARRIVKKKKR
jgi:hypothetical protein